MSDLDDLFGDDEEQQQQEDAGGQPLLGGDGPDQAENLEDVLDEPARNPAEVDDRALFGSDDEEQPEQPAQPAHAPTFEVTAPLIPRPPKDQTYLLKLTNIVGVEPRPFDPASYHTEETVYFDSSGHRRVRLRDTNVIRWRYATAPDGSLLLGPDGQPVKESNARIIRWSDGSETLQLGSEMLQVTKQNIQADNAYLYAVRYDIVQGLAQLGTRVALQPLSLRGGLHQKLKERVAVHTRQEEKVRYHVPSQDPEAEKAAAEAAQKQVIRAGLQARRVADRFRVVTGRRPGAPAALTADYLEEDDYDELGGGGYDEYDSDQELRRGRGRGRYDEEEEDAAARRLQAAKRSAAAMGRSEGPSSKWQRGGSADLDGEEGEEGEEGGGGGSGEEGGDAAAAGGIRRRKQTLVEDDDE